MTRPTLAIDNTASPLAQRIIRLQAEAKGLAREHVTTLVAALVEVERLSAEIAKGGDAFPVGVRDIARRLAEDAASRAKTITSLQGRV